MAKMDRELAGAVLGRWQSGEPVSETALYKMAQALGVDPQSALTEARFFTYLDSYLLEKRAMSKAERLVFSAAAGFDAGSMTKTASAHGLSPDELIIEALRERNFVPDLEKISSLRGIGKSFRDAASKGSVWEVLGDPKDVASGVGKAVRGAGYLGGAVAGGKVVKDAITGKSKEAMIPPMDPAMMGGAAGGQPPGGAPPPGAEGGDPMAAQAGAAMMGPPQQGAQLQQQPGARMRPTPTAPEQVAPSEMGNIEELLAQTQQMYGGQATENGGVPPAGQPQPAPPPPSSIERIMQVGPNLPPEVAQRYAETLDRFEQGNPDMQISDPKQMVNFVKELQKVDQKRIDQGIKAMAKQLEQEQAQEMGIDGGVPTIDGGGGPQVLAPKPGAEQAPAGGGGEAAGGGASGGPPQASNQEAGPEAQQVAEEMAAGGGGGGKPPGKSSPPPQKAQQAAPSQAAVEKVAHVARLLARSSRSF